MIGIFGFYRHKKGPAGKAAAAEVRVDKRGTSIRRTIISQCFPETETSPLNCTACIYMNPSLSLLSLP